MSPKHITGLFMASLFYLIIAGGFSGLLFFAGKKLIKSDESRRVFSIVILVAFVLGGGIWLYLVRDLQRAFGT